MSEETIIEQLQEAEQIAKDSMSRGTFDIMSAVKGRAHPSTLVDIYLDEQTAYEAAEIAMEIEESTANDIDDKRLKKLKTDLDVLVEKLNESKYVFKITGISEGAREDLLNVSTEKYPVEYEESKIPFVNDTEKVEVENRERDRYFTNLLWAAHVTEIVAPDGSVQSNISIDDATELRRSLPVAAIASLNEAIEKVRAATAVFMARVNEDFLPKR